MQTERGRGEEKKKITKYTAGKQEPDRMVEKNRGRAGEVARNPLES